MTPWLEALRNRPAAAGDAILVTVLSVRGSAPREPGAKMLVDREGITGTIGGGVLEHRCAKLACTLLNPPEPGHPVAFAHKFALGPGMGQCCGGVVEVLFESVNASKDWIHDLLECHEQRRPAVIATEPPADGQCTKYLVTADRLRAYGTASFRLDTEITNPARRLLAEHAPARRIDMTARDGSKLPVLLEPFGVPGISLALFGAGHVGSAVVAAMAGLDCEIRWIDNRRGVFPAVAPSNVTMIESGEPIREIAAMPPGAYYLVMTHDHPLDFEICAAALRREDFAYVGLIGSRTKRHRFEHRMKDELPSALLERLTCPIGIEGVGGKRPAEIAIAVAAELLKIQAAVSARHAGPTGNTDNVHVFRRP